MLARPRALLRSDLHDTFACSCPKHQGPLDLPDRPFPPPSESNHGLGVCSVWMQQEARIEKKTEEFKRMHSIFDSKAMAASEVCLQVSRSAGRAPSGAFSHVRARVAAQRSCVCQTRHPHWQRVPSALVLCEWENGASDGCASLPARAPAGCAAGRTSLRRSAQSGRSAGLTHSTPG